MHSQHCMSFEVYVYHTAAVSITSGFTDGTSTIWLDEVGCRGTETSLFDCSANSLGQHDCVHSEDAGVRCTGATCTRGDVRLRGGSVIQGRVEICNNNVWGTVCDVFWDEIDARVFCGQLGLPSSSTLFRLACMTVEIYFSE
jgi:hypothetical protein